MAFDAGFLSTICRELTEELSDSRLERVFQCTRDTFVFEFRAAKRPRALFVSAGPSGGFCYLTERKISHPDTPPMFCMLLRKHLAGGRFLRAVQCGFERVLRIDIEFVDAFGSPLLRTLYLEAMGKNSNLILCDENGMILGALRTLDLAQNPDRPLLCGMEYTAPPTRSGAVSLPDASLGTHLRSAFSSAARESLAEKVLLSAVSGISPSVAREVLYRATGETAPRAEQVDVETVGALLAEFYRACCGSEEFFAYFEACGASCRIVEYSYAPLTMYRGLICEIFHSPSRLLDAILGEREKHERLRQRTERANAVLKSATKRLKRKLDAQLADLSMAEGCEEKRLFGDLIMQEIWRIKRGDSVLVAANYETGAEVKIELDSRISPAQNAQRYYKQYQKQKRTLLSVRDQIEETCEQLAYAESISEALARVENPAEADEICREVAAWGYGKRFLKTESQRGKKAKKEPGVRVETLESPNGFPVLIGKNNLQNEEVTFRIASKQDLWFHVKDRPGPHVVLHVEGGRIPTDTDLNFAAALALPKELREIGGAVDYTQIKHVKHHPSRLPGRVIYTGERSIFVRKED